MRTKRVLTAALLLALAGHAFADVQHGVLRVTEVDALDTAASVTIAPTVGFGVWTVDAAASNRGDFKLNFGTANDAGLGVLFAAAYQNGRTEPSVIAGAAPFQATAQAYASGTNFFIDTRIAGNIANNGADCNYNSTFGYFPFADGWLGAWLVNSANNGVLTSATGNVTLRTEMTYTGTGSEFLDYNITGSPVGVYLLHSDTIDFRRDGVLLTCGGKDEDNRASWSTNYATGEAFIWCQDNGADSTSGENDPVAFVFIPENTPGVTMGTVTATAKKLFKQGDFTVTMFGQPATDGTFRLTIAGETPNSGTLLLSPYVRPDRSGTTIDNPVWAEPDGDGWLITTRDQPGLGLQDLTGWDVAFSFAFLKNGVSIMPGTPSKSYLNKLNDVAAGRFSITEFAPDNGNGDMDCVRSAGNPILDVAGTNRGDNQISYLGALLPSVYDNSLDTLAGFMLGSVSEFIRDNSTTGGVSGWSTLSFDNGDAVSHAAALTGGEINSNFSLVHFPAARNFQGASDVGMTNGLLSVPITDNATTDGVLMAINWDNNNRTIQVTPNGTQYDLTAYEAQNVTITTVNYTMGQVAVDSVECGLVYLPYSTPGIIAGQIAADGTVSSGAGTFTVSLAADTTLAFDIFELTIPGVDARTDGVLLLNSTGGGHAMAWEPGENGEFEIAGLDLLTQTPGRNAFMFAYIPYQGFGVQTVTSGACCSGSICSVVAQIACTGANTRYVGSGSVCNTSANNVAPCCKADFNQSGGVTVQDIFDFLAGYFGNNAQADINASGGVTVQDIFDFLAAYFAGC